MTSEITQLEINRRRIVIGSLVGFIVWQLPVLVNSLIDRQVFQLTGWSAAISGLGGLVFAFYMFRLVQLSWMLRNKRKLVNSLNDEYVRLIRIKSFTVGFWVLLGVSVILLLLSQWIHFNVQFALLTIIFIGVITFLFAYLIYEKE